jgi:hypothetical protein
VTTTLIQMIGILLIVATVPLIAHHVREGQRRRDREIVRRLQRYLDAIPPARPW